MKHYTALAEFPKNCYAVSRFHTSNIPNSNILEQVFQVFF